MHKCWSCRAELLHDARYCHRCGLSQDDRHSLPLYVVDAGTGLFNAIFLQALIDHELTRAWRHKRPLSVIALELDHQGTPQGEGDRALGRLSREASGVIKAVIRDTDTMGFLEGSSRPRFALLLPETDWEGAVRAANKVRHAVATHDFEHGGTYRSHTLSCGVAAYDPVMLDKPNLLQLAVLALETGQAAGPNRIHAPRV